LYKYHSILFLIEISTVLLINLSSGVLYDLIPGGYFSKPIPITLVKFALGKIEEMYFLTSSARTAERFLLASAFPKSSL